jgi:hypothetical protein
MAAILGGYEVSLDRGVVLGKQEERIVNEQK